MTGCALHHETGADGCRSAVVAVAETLNRYDPVANAAGVSTRGTSVDWFAPTVTDGAKARPARGHALDR